MKTAPRRIGPLDKLLLSLKASPFSGSAAAEAAETEASLIFGIGVDGVTPFETLLFGKTVGERLDVSIEKGCPEDFFGHLTRELLPSLRMTPPFRLNVTIRAIETAESREVVQALAKTAGDCGGDCDCGCGCG
jgi:hypothetical protein